MKVGRDHKTVKRCCLKPRNAEEIKDQLRKLKAERNRVRAILEGKKEHKLNRST